MCVGPFAQVCDNPDDFVPLVMALHCFGGKAKGEQDKFMPVADAYGFVLVTPEGFGSQQSWNGRYAGLRRGPLFMAWGFTKFWGGGGGGLAQGLGISGGGVGTRPRYQWGGGVEPSSTGRGCPLTWMHA